MKRHWKAIVAFLIVMGPGLITLEAGNDAGDIATFTQFGGQYGLGLIWILLFLLPVVYFTQEMVVRLGIVTGRGHAAAIYNRLGKWWGRFALFDLLLANFFTIVTEFALVAILSNTIGVSSWLTLPFAVLGLIVIVLTGSYKKWERIVVMLSLFDVLWIVAAFVVFPSTAVHAITTPVIPIYSFSIVFLLLSLIGAILAPWQPFFQQSAIADKHLKLKDLKFARLDTLIGAFTAVIVAGAMILIGSVLYYHGIQYQDLGQLVTSLNVIYGNTIGMLLMLLMFNAAIHSTTSIALSSAWSYGDVKGVLNSLEMKYRDAKTFYNVYILCVVLAALIVLIPSFPLQVLIISVQVLAAILMPSSLLFLLILMNDKETLGNLTNPRWKNIIIMCIIIVLVVLSLVLAVQFLNPNAIGGDA